MNGHTLNADFRSQNAHLPHRNAVGAARQTTANRLPRCCAFVCSMLVVLASANPVCAQGSADDSTGTASDPAELLNPINMVEDAGQAIPGFEGGLSTGLNIIILLTVLTLAPAVLVMCTSFTRIIIVLGLLRQAMGTQSMPPSQVITGISLFLTFLIMTPTINQVYSEAIVPYQQGDPEFQSQLDVWNKAREPIREFMFNQIDAAGNWDAVYMLLEYRGVDVSDPSKLTYDDVDMITLVPSFVMSELKVAFLTGFRIYLPFLIIDMVIASLLISMGMLMLPPVLISLPFKLLLFVLVDGWNLVISSLLTGFVQPEMISSAPPGAGAQALAILFCCVVRSRAPDGFERSGR
jgi:flagellar biosynthetic protein FliP